MFFIAYAQSYAQELWKNCKHLIVELRVAEITEKLKRENR